MDDLEITLPDSTSVAGALAAIGRTLGAAGVGLEGGGTWGGVAHYLVADGARALGALEAAGLGPATVRPAVVVGLDADVPGALGRLMDRVAASGIRLRAQYSDHDNRKVLVVEPGDLEALRAALV